MPPVVPPFLIGLIAAPLAKRVVKPLMRGLVKTSVGLVLEVGRVAHEASEGVQDLAAEVTAEVVAAQMAGGDGARGTEPAPRPRRPPRPTGTTRPRPSARPPSPPTRRTETPTPCPFQGKTSGIR
ncbi:DUF5132 domain-containing protein [Streptomyces griseoruber]|uniref:DUF5132 domain-containing protein n=1 Tax=Streptomyces griseoruber TaxID=1943 RepID=UPI00099EEA13|nr:DUF5132 domain-containing protein [Streptomyces griseoruber]